MGSFSGLFPPVAPETIKNVGERLVHLGSLRVGFAVIHLRYDPVQELLGCAPPMDFCEGNFFLFGFDLGFFQPMEKKRQRFMTPLTKVPGAAISRWVGRVQKQAESLLGG